MDGLAAEPCVIERDEMTSELLEEPLKLRKGIKAAPIEPHSLFGISVRVVTLQHSQRRIKGMTTTTELEIESKTKDSLQAYFQRKNHKLARFDVPFPINVKRVSEPNRNESAQYEASLRYDVPLKEKTEEGYGSEPWSVRVLWRKFKADSSYMISDIWVKGTRI